MMFIKKITMRAIPKILTNFCVLMTFAPYPRTKTDGFNAMNNPTRISTIWSKYFRINCIIENINIYISE